MKYNWQLKLFFWSLLLANVLFFLRAVFLHHVGQVIINGLAAFLLAINLAIDACGKD